MVLANCLYPEEKQMSGIFMTGGCFATWSQALTEVRLLPSHRNWEIVPRSLRKAFLDHKADKRPKFWKEFICISKRGERRKYL